MDNIVLTDFPKLQSPFIREEFAVNIDQWGKFGNNLQLRQPKAYLVINKIRPGYEWVFESEDTIAVEKLDGTNVKLLTNDGELISVYNRKNPFNPLQIIKGKTFIMEGIFQSVGKGYVEKNGEQAGELIGPKIQGNHYQLITHLWYPFTKAIKHLSYRSFHEHDRTFENWSSWFKDGLFSRFHAKRATTEERIFAEGIVFYNLKRKEQGLTYMAKLRRDMFDWFYSDKIEIYDYKP